MPLAWEVVSATLISAFDGTRFWTNHREQNQIVSFALPN